MKRTLVYILFSLLFLPSTLRAQSDLRLWYNEPAKDWMKEALPLGNGYMGVMFFGGIKQEQLQFTEGTLWSGGPHSSSNYDFGNKPDSWKHLQEIRNLIKEGDLEEADQMASKYFAGEYPAKTDGSADFGTFGAQQTMGDLFVSVDAKGQDLAVKDYKRELDISTATASVSYELSGNRFERIYFGNYPKGVMVYQFSSQKPVNYQIEYRSPHQKTSDNFEQGIYRFLGHVNDNHQEFTVAYKVITDGEQAFENGVLTVSNAKRIMLVHTAATEYALDYPLYQGNKHKEIVDQRLAGIDGLSFNQLQQEAQQDYQQLFNRVNLELGGPRAEVLTTDLRQKSYYEGARDVGLEILYFQYGRYLMISGSRPGTMLMSLQGKWNNSTNPPWAGDYHMNINQQMIYWPAEVTNLAECHEPLLDYTKSLIAPGQVTAKSFFNTRGWVVNTMNNAFGYTAPGWGLPWGFFPGGAAWLAQHAWEHFEFSLDTAYLQQTAYPIMKEASLFWVDYLISDENGKLVSSPSYSPEHGGISGGASMDHQIAWDVLNNTRKAALIMGEDTFASEVERIKDQILKPQIGRWGQLQEWKEDVDDSTSKHRHISHLFALHPGRQISPVKTPALAEAARVTLESRGDDGTGWSLAWKVNFWARLKDGNRAHKLYKMILKPSGAGGTGSGSYANLLDAHPPFQLDGNMGATAGVAEMLLQSHTGDIELLPALPAQWPSGKIKGLRARGGYTVDIEWEKREMKSATIYSTSTQTVNILYQGKSIQKDIKENQPLKLAASEWL